MVQDGVGAGGAATSGCSLSLSRVSAMWHEQGAWEEPMQEADKRLQVAKAFFHTNLVTHPSPLPTRSSQQRSSGPIAGPQRSAEWNRDICDKASENNRLPL